jgi:hypothetical protein
MSFKRAEIAAGLFSAGIRIRSTSLIAASWFSASLLSIAIPRRFREWQFTATFRAPIYIDFNLYFVTTMLSTAAAGGPGRAFK